MSSAVSRFEAAAGALVRAGADRRLQRLLQVLGDVQGAQTGAREKDGHPDDTLQRDPVPGMLHWIVAVILGVVLIGGLVHVFRVLRSGNVLALTRTVPEGMRTVECGACHAMQYVTTHGRIFICCSCHSANRIPLQVPSGEVQELVTTTGPLKMFQFIKGGENYWQELKREESEGGTPTEAADLPSELNTPAVIGRQSDTNSDTSPGSESGGRKRRGPGLPQCVVCLDSIGCMVLLPCAHGGVCEDCATRIAQNRASGGAHCPHCRSQIQTLVKIHEIEGEVAKGIEHRIPMARAV